MDPLSDPVYNITQIIKQSLLLEDHLIEQNKRCNDCILKHFLTIVALQEEALLLAGTRVDMYPLMRDNAVYYQQLYEMWLENRRGDDNIYFYIAEKLRYRRKELVGIYVLK